MYRDVGKSYDELPYEDFAYYHTHPSNLAVVATLCGLSPPNVSNCRVLELGCGTGFNLLAMAQSLPDAQFVGIDLSERQIEIGRTNAAAVGCRSVDLLVGDVSALEASLGDFDYVIAHGLFSWVPSHVQAAIMAICKDHLTPRGIAYISYNTYPGWHQRILLRDILRFHAPAGAHPLEQAQRARAALEKIVADLPDATTHYARFLEAEVESLRSDPDVYVFHEFLESHNQPILFHEFAALANSHGLQFVGEARYGTNSFVQEAGLQEVLATVSDDLIRREQHHDFLRNRFFRQSLLCHADHQPTWLSTTEAVNHLHILGDRQPRSTNDPALQSVNDVLRETWPCPIAVAEVTRQPRDASLSTIVRGYAEQRWQLFAFDPPFATRLSDRPIACPLARWQAGRNREVTNRLHRPVELNADEQAVICLLDGQSPPEELASKLPTSAERIAECLQTLMQSVLLIR